MQKPEDFKLISGRVEALIMSLEKSHDPEKRMQSLRRLRSLLDEIDALNSTPLNLESKQALPTYTEPSQDESVLSLGRD